MRVLSSRDAKLVLAITAFVVAIPSTALAVDEARRDFNLDGDDPLWERVPASSSNDISMPARANGNGHFLSNMFACPSGDHAYNTRLRRNRTAQPDEDIETRNNRNYCSGQLDISTGWPSGTFHFDFRPYYVNQADSAGYGGTRW